jgi:IS30 family transposase
MAVGRHRNTIREVLSRPLPPPRPPRELKQPRLTPAEQRRVYDLVAAGHRYAEVAAMVGVHRNTVGQVVARLGGMAPRWKDRSPSRLSLAEREEISLGLARGLSCRAIAAGLGRHPTTVSREVAANGGGERYRAAAADRRALCRAARPKPAKLAVNPELRAEVETLLGQRWSPQQIAARLRAQYPDDPEWWVSHEMIYQSLFLQSRGALRKELAACLRSGRTQRRPQSRAAKTTGSRIKDKVMISQRPAEADDRAVPGHWEGDLILGSKASNSAVVTLVERSTRYVMLGRIGANHTAANVTTVLTQLVQRLPTELARSITWDQGAEMARHAQFTIDTGIQIYFCDPHSPWQRGSNENTNGLLRQYLPKGADLRRYTQDDLDDIARELNGRPRQTLDWMTPSEKLDELMR